MKNDHWLSHDIDAGTRRMGKRVFGIAGLSNSGKTTLIEKLLACFRKQGYTVSSIKHSHHGFDIDKPGKDSFRMREAGAQEVLLVGDQRLVLMQEYGDAGEPGLEMLVGRLGPCDFILVEGFKASPAPKIEVFRPSLGRAPLWPSNSSIVAVASDEKIVCPLLLLDINNPSQIVNFIKAYRESSPVHPYQSMGS